MDKKQDVNYVKQYLKYAIEFEKNVFVLSNAVWQAKQRLAIAQRNYENAEGNRKSLISQKNKYPSYFESEKKKLIDIIENKGERLKKIKIRGLIFLISVIFLIILLWTAIDIDSGVKLMLSVGILLLLFYLFLFLIWRFGFEINGDREELTKARDELKLYTQKALDSKIEQFNVKINEAQSLVAQKKYLVVTTNNSFLELNKALQIAQDNLTSFYSVNVLHEKYRSLNAVTTLYEYLDTRKCNTIEGHGGIFDTYDYDLKLGLIIKNLVDIKNSLNRIEVNQLYLYREIQDANNSLREMTNSLIAIETSSASTSKSSAEAAIAQQQTNANVQWMAWKAWSNGY